MGWQFTREIDKRKLPPSEKSVWRALADLAHDDEGIEDARAYPAVYTLSWKTGLSERTVKRMLKNLRDRGAIVETQTYDHGTSRTYRIVLDAVPINPTVPIDLRPNDPRIFGRKKSIQG